MAATYIPKGSMCKNCQDALKDCSHLPFNTMRVLTRHIYPELAVVLCSEFKHKETKQMANHLVAVYGTLRKGEGNHRLLEGAEFIGKGTCDVPGTMYSNGGFPILSFHEPHAYPIVEVYQVNDEQLKRLDRLEGYVSPEDHWYNRSQYRMVLEDGGKFTTCTAWIYHQDAPREMTVIPHGDWKYRHKL